MDLPLGDNVRRAHGISLTLPSHEILCFWDDTVAIHNTFTEHTRRLFVVTEAERKELVNQRIVRFVFRLDVGKGKR